MKRTTLKHHIEALTSETMMLLRFQLAFNRLSKFNNISTFGRSEFVDLLIALKAIENDMVLRLCKLDDTTKGVHSFPKALNEVPASHQNKIELQNKIRLFHKLIRPTKLTRRHTELAHLKIGAEDGQYEINYNFLPILKLVVEIVDLLNIKCVNYTWKDGSQEIFDLRKEIFLT